MGRLVLGGSISHSHHVKASIEQMSSSFVFFLSSSDFYSVCQPSFSPAHPCKRQGKTLGRHPSRGGLGSLISPQLFGGSQLRHRNTALVLRRVGSRCGCDDTLFSTRGPTIVPRLMSCSVLANLLVVGSEYFV